MCSDLLDFDTLLCPVLTVLTYSALPTALQYNYIYC